MKQPFEGLRQRHHHLIGEESVMPKAKFGWPFRLLAVFVAFLVFFQGPILVAATVINGTTANFGSAVAGDPSFVILNLGTSSYAVTVSSGSFVSIGGGSVALGSGTQGTTVTLGGSGTLAIGGTGFVVTAGTLSLGSSLAVSLVASQTWTVNSGLQMIVAGSISGTGDLTKKSGGTLTLSGVNTYTGSTSILAGSLIAGAGALANTGTILLTGGTLSAVDVNSSVAFTGSAGTVAKFTGSGLTLGSVNEAGSLTFSSATGTVVLGSLQGSGITTFAANASLQSGSIAAGTVNVAGRFTGSVAGGSLTVGGSQTSGAVSGGVVTGTSASAVASVGTMSGGAMNLAGGLSVTNLSGGIVTAAGSANATLLSGGTLIANGGGALSSMTSGSLVVASGANLGLATVNIPLSGGAIVANGSLSIATGSIGGSLGGIGTLTKIGAGSLEFLGLSTTANAFSGTINVSAGTLSAQSSAPLLLSNVSVMNVSGGALLIAKKLGDNAVLTVGTAGVASLSSGTLSLFNSYGTSSFSSNLTIGTLVGTGSIGLSGNATVLSVTSGSITQGTISVVGLGAAVSANVAGGSITATSLTSGSLTVSGGSISLTGAGVSSIGTLTGGTLSVAGTLQVSSGSYTGGGIGGTGSLAKIGSGSLTLNSVSTYSGTTNVSGTLVATVAQALGATSAVTVNAGSSLFAKDLGTASPVLTLGNAAVVTLSGTNNITLSGVSNAGSLTFSGTSGTVTLGSLTGLAGVTNFSSNATLAGSLTGGTVNANGYFSAGTVFGGTLKLLAGGSVSTLLGGSITGNGTFLVGAGSTSASVLGGNLALEKLGAGSLSLGASNSYSGGTKVSGGTLSINNATAIGSGSLELAGGSLNNTSGNVVVLTNDNLQKWSSDFTFLGANALNLGGGSVTMTGDRQVTVSTSTLTVGGTISGALFTLTKAGAGDLLLSGSNALSGVVLNGGSLILGNAGALAGGSLAVNTGTLSLGGFTASISSGSFLGGSILNGSISGGTQITVSGANIGASLLGDASILKTGSATATLSGAANSYAGGTTLSGGTLNLNSNTALGAGSLNIAGGSLGNSSGAGVTLASNPTQLWSNDFSFVGSSTLNLGGGNVTMAGGNRTVTVTSSTLTVGGVIADGNLGYRLSKAGDGMLILSSANTFGGGFSLLAGTVVANAAGALSTGILSVSAGSLDLGGFTHSFVGQVSVSGGVLSNGTVDISSDLSLSGGSVLASLKGAGGIVMNGSAVATLGATNTFNGDTTLTAGTLALNNNAALGGGLFYINGGSLTNTSGGLVSVSNQQTWGGSFGFFGSNNLALNAQATLTNNILLNVSSAKLTVGALSGPNSLTKIGSGSLEFSAANTFSGTLNLNAGTVLLSAANAFPSIKALSVNAGSLDLGGNSQTLASATNFAVQGGTVTNGNLVVSGSINLASGSVAAIVSGTGTIVKTGSGTATLTGPNTFTGGTTLNAGTLFLQTGGAIGSGTLTLAGGTLANATAARLTLGNNAQIWAGSFAYFGASGLDAGSGAVTLANNVGVNVVSGSLLVGGTISGGYGFDKSGVGTLVLSGSNLYTGLTTVSAGTLRADANALSSTSGISVAAPANAILNWIGATGSVPSLANSGSVSFLSTGTVFLTSVSGNGVTNYANDAAFLSAVTSGTHILSPLGNGFMSGDISAGSVSAKFVSVGTLSGGTLSISDSTRLSTINVLSGGAITNGGSLQLSIGTLTGALAGFGVVEKIGSSTALRLNGDNTFGGGLTVSAGTLLAKNFTGFPTLSVAGSSRVNVYGGGQMFLSSLTNQGSVTFSGATSSVNMFTYSGSGTTSFANNGTIGFYDVLTTQDNLISAGSVISAGNLWVIGTISGGYVSARNTSYGLGALGQMSISGGTLRVTDEVNLESISGSSTVVVQTNNQSTSTIGLISDGNVSLQGKLSMNGGAIVGGSVYVGQTAGISLVSGGTLTVLGAFQSASVAGGSLFLKGDSTIDHLNGGTISMFGPLAVRDGSYTGINGGISGDATFTKIVDVSNGPTSFLTNFGADGNYILPFVGKGIGNADRNSSLALYNGVLLPGGGTLQNFVSGGSFSMPGVGYLDTDGVAKRNDDTYALNRYSQRLDLMGVNNYTGDTIVRNGIVVASEGAMLHTSNILVSDGGKLNLTGSKTIVDGSVTFVNAFSGNVQTVLGRVTQTAYSAIMGGSLTAVDVNPSGQTTLTVDALGIATFSGSNLGFSTITNDAPAFYYLSTTPGATTLSGSYLSTQLGVYFTNASGTITVGSITGKGYTRFAGNLAGGVIDVTSPGILSTDDGLNTGVVVDKVLYSDVRNGRVTAGALDLANITGGTIWSHGPVRITGVYSGGFLDVSGTAAISTVNFATTGHLRLFGKSSIDYLNTVSQTGRVVSAFDDLTVGTINGGMYSQGVLTVSSGVLSSYYGGGGLVKAGTSDTLLLSGSNTFGNVTLSAGTLLIGNAGGFSTGLLTLSSGTLVNSTGSALAYAGLSQRWNGDFTYMGPYNLTAGGSVTLLQSSTLTVLSGSLIEGGVVFGGTSGESFGITKKGVGTLQLNGMGNFSGGLTVSGGNLNAGITGALGSGSVAVNSDSILNLGNTTQVLEGMVLGGTDNSGALSGGYVFGGTVAAKSYTLWSGSVTSALNDWAVVGTTVSAPLVKSGSGTVVLSGSIGYTGATTINGGSLLYLSSQSGISLATVANNGYVGFTNTSGTVSLAGLSGGGRTNFSSWATLGALDGSGTVSVTGTLSVGAGNYAGNFSASGFNKVGAGSLVLGGVNTIAGVTTVSGGTLVGLAQGALSATTGVIVQGASADALASLSVVDYNPTASLSVGSFGIATVSGSSLTLPAGAANEGSLVFSASAGTLNLGSLTGSGFTTFNAATVVGGSISQGTILSLSTLKAAISGGQISTASLITGTLYGGSVTLTGSGTSTITAVAAGSISIGASSVLQLNRATAASIFGSGTLVKVGSLDTITLSNSNLFAGTVQVTEGFLNAVDLGSANRLSIGVAGVATISGTNNLSLQTVLNAGSLNFSGTLGTVSLLSLSGNGATDFQSNASVTSGGINGGVVSVKNTLTVVGGVSGGILSVGTLVADSVTGGSLTFKSGTSSIGSVTGGTLTNNATLQLTSGSLASVMRGNGTLVKVGAFETLTIQPGYLPQIGAVSVLDGALEAVDFGTLTATNLNVNSAATALVSGTGLTLGAVTNSGVVNFTGGSLTLASLQGAGGETNVAGSLVISGSFSSGNLNLGSAATIAALNGGTISSDFALVVNGSGAASGPIGTMLTGDLSLLKIGSGELSLGTLNTYTGGTTISAGTLNLNHTAALGSGSLNIGDGVFLNNTSGHSVTLITHDEVWAGSFTFLGSNDLSLGEGNFVMNGPRTVTVSAGTLTMAGTITGGSYGFTKQGNGSLVLLSGSASFNGGLLDLNAGTLLFGGSSMLGGATLRVNSGKFDLSGRSQSASNVTLSGNGSIENGTLVSDGSFSVASGVIAARIAGNGSLDKFGPGSVSLSAYNDYIGGTKVSGGTLNIDGGHAVGSGSIYITAGGLGTTSGSLVTLSTNNTQIWGGSFAFSGGSLDMGTGIVTMTGDRTVTVNSGSLFERGVIGGAFSLTKDGGGTLVLGAQNGYTGGTVLKDGVLLLSGTNILPSNSLSASGGLLDLGGGSYAFQTLSLTGGSIANGTLSSANDYTLQSGSVLAVLSGSVGLIKSGVGSLTLSGANTYSGTTSVVGGTLILNGNAYDVASVLSVGTSGAAVISGTNLVVSSLLNSGAVRFSGSTGLITLGSLVGGGRLSFDSDAILNSVIQNSQVTVAGTLTADITSGSVTVGVLNPDAAISRQVVGGLITTTNPSGVSRVPVLSGGTFVLGGTLAVSSGSYTGGGITGSGKLDQVDPSGTLVVNGNNTNIGSLGVAGTLLFTGTSAVGITTNNGSLEFRSTASVGLLSGAGTTTFAGASATIGTLSGSTIKGNSVLTVLSGSYNGTIGGSLALVKSGSETLTLGGSSSYTGGTRLVAGTLNLNNAAAISGGSLSISDGSKLGNTSGGSLAITGVSRINAGSFTFGGNGDLSFESTPIVLGSNVLWTVNSSTLSLGGVISGVGYSLSKDGAGRLALSGTNTFSGGLTVLGGTLAINQVGAIGLGSLVMKNGTILELVGDTALSSFALEGTARIVTTGSASLAFSGTFSLPAGDITQSLSGAGALEKVGYGIVVLSGTNTYKGGSTLSSGTLDLRNSNALSTGSLTLSGGILDAGTSNVQLTVSSQVWSGSFGFLGTNDLNLGSGSVSVQQVVNIDAKAGTLTVGGSISGSGGISKSGDGTVKFTAGSLSYSAPTSVSAGTLEFAPTTASVQLGALVLGGSAQVTIDANKLLKLTSIVSSGGSLTGAGSMQVGSASVSAGNSLVVSTSLTGALTKTGAGSMTLNSANSLSSLALGDGILNLNNSGALGSAVLTVSGGSLDSLVSGGTVLSGASQVWGGSFNFVGTNNLNTGSGAVAVASTPTVSVKGGTLAVGTVVSGGTSGLVKDGAGRLQLVGSTFTGVTAVTQGTLEYSSGSVVSGSVVLSPSTALALNGTFNAAALNVGSQSVVILGGSGSLSVGTFAFGSSKAESGGSLQTAAGSTTNFVGTLKGSGSISGSGKVVFGSGSVLDIGYSPGVLTVSGGATMSIASSGVTVNFEYDPSGATQDYSNITVSGALASDRIVVQAGGSLTFQNSATMTLTPKYLSGKAPQPGKYYEFPLVIVNGGTINALSASNVYSDVSAASLDTYFKLGSTGSMVVSGSFSQLTGGTVDVTLYRKSYQALAAAGNLGATASMLDSILLAGSYTANIGTLFTKLDSSVSSSELNAVLAAINPAPYTELGNIGMSRMMDLQAALQGHLDTLVLGVLSDSEPSIGEARDSTAWTSVYGGWATRDGSDSLGRPGYNSSNSGNISGVEHRFGDLTLGITGAVGSTSASFKGTGASLSTDTWHAGFYGSLPLELEEFGLVFDAGLVYGQGEAKMKRSLSAVGLGELSGNVSSTEWMGQLGFSVPSLLPDDTTTITPSLHLIYGSYSQKAVNEGSLTGVEAKVAAYSQTSAATRLGLQAAKLLRIGRLPARLTASMNWLHSFDSQGRKIDISFAGANSKSGQFSGSQSGMDAIRLGLGSELAITDRTRFLLTIDHQIQKGQSSTTGNASVGVQF